MSQGTSSSGAAMYHQKVGSYLEAQGDQFSETNLQKYITRVDPSLLRAHVLQLLSADQAARSQFVDMVTLFKYSAEAQGQVQWVDIGSILAQ